MTLAAVLLACAAFLVALRLSRIEHLALDAAASFRKAIAAMRSEVLTEKEKERLVQEGAVHLIKHFAAISLIGVAVLAVPMLVLLALDALGVTSFRAAVDLSLRWEIISGTCIVAIVVWLARR